MPRDSSPQGSRRAGPGATAPSPLEETHALVILRRVANLNVQPAPLDNYERRRWGDAGMNRRDVDRAVNLLAERGLIELQAGHRGTCLQITAAGRAATGPRLVEMLPKAAG